MSKENKIVETLDENGNTVFLPVNETDAKEYQPDLIEESWNTIRDLFGKIGIDDFTSDFRTFRLHFILMDTLNLIDKLRK